MTTMYQDKRNKRKKFFRVIACFSLFLSSSNIVVSLVSLYGNISKGRICTWASEKEEDPVRSYIVAA